MRLVATEYVSLDGIFDEPGEWSFPYFNEEAMQYKSDELATADAQLLGRKTYEGFAKAWPTMEGTGDFGVKFNSMPKYVVTSTLKKLDWSGSKPISGDIAAEVRKLKKQPGKDLLLQGSGMLFNFLMRENLIDVYKLMVHPVVIGHGNHLFQDTDGVRKLRVVDSKRFVTGVVTLELVPEALTA
jgi:dihydrofolate reductase